MYHLAAILISTMFSRLSGCRSNAITSARILENIKLKQRAKTQMV